MNSMELRKKFFAFFEKHGHTKVPSSPLIPAQDPTLLFANAGMNQFKDVFLGKEKRSYTRAVTIQKCIRAGGKHNDLENVGRTKRHLTFFEMMGNFSFDDFFKKEAIQFAWDFLTKEMQFDQSKMYVSVFETDDESYNVWADVIKFPKERIVRLGAVDNFWQMGDTGPCGPCTEIYLDRGKDTGCGKKECALGCECDRFLEVWNLVFMQYNKQEDGELKPLKARGVDTGMGLERLAIVMQNKNSVFETDLFTPLISTTEKLTGVHYAQANEELKTAFHVIADHVRSSALAIADGVSPSNDGRGYVLRKIIRRAALFAQKLTDKNIFPDVADAFIDAMSPVYKELATNRNMIKAVLTSEIERFADNLVSGQRILDGYFDVNKKAKQITGEQAFKLYDTYGFPVELTNVIAAEKGYTVDVAGFEQEMEKQRQQSGKKDTTKKISLPETIVTEFTGYQEHERSSTISTLIENNQQVKELKQGATGWVVCKESPFFVECGGQINDEGWLEYDGHRTPILDLQKIDNAIAIKVKAPTPLNVGDTVHQVVNSDVRINTMKNHTATHLLQAALIELFGKQIKQSGSIVTPDYLRFDFTYHKNLSPDEIKQVEDIVNQKIRDNIPLTIYTTTYRDAIKKGVMAIFGEKYNPEDVRVIDVPGFSMELCGGTHVVATGDIGCFKITDVSALSAGNRRIVALTGPKALELFQQDFNRVKALSQDFKVQPHEVLDAVVKQKEQLALAQKQLKQLKQQLWRIQLPTWLQQVETINKVPLLALVVDGFASDELKEIVTALQTKQPGFYLVVSNQDGRSLFYAEAHKKVVDTVSMKSFAMWLKSHYNLRGGGKGLTLQGGGPVVDHHLPKEIKQWFSNGQSSS